MKPELKKALYLLENIGYTVKPITEAMEQDLVDVIKAKYDEWEKIRKEFSANDPRARKLWDELKNTYGTNTIRLAVTKYDDIKAGKTVDLSHYIWDKDTPFSFSALFDSLKKVGIKSFKVNTKYSDAFKFYSLLKAGFKSGRVELELDTQDDNPEYAYFIVND